MVINSLPSRQGTGQAVESEAAVPHIAGAAQVPGNINEERSHHQVSGPYLVQVLHEVWPGFEECACIGETGSSFLLSPADECLNPLHCHPHDTDYQFYHQQYQFYQRHENLLYLFMTSSEPIITSLYFDA